MGESLVALTLSDATDLQPEAERRAKHGERAYGNLGRSSAADNGNEIDALTKMIKTDADTSMIYIPFSLRFATGPTISHHPNVTSLSPSFRLRSSVIELMYKRNSKN